MAVLIAPALLAVAVSISSAVSMVDAPLGITVRGAPNAVVALELTTSRYGMTFESHKTITLPKSGTIGAGMDLFWTVMPNGTEQPYDFGRDSDLAPRPFTISATSGKQVATVSGVRQALSPAVERTVVDSASLVGTLFSAKSNGCRPGVIVLGGSEGGIPEEQAALFASHGFTALALAYFGVAGLPGDLNDIPIETVQKGLTFMGLQKSVCPGGVALFGGSKGAELSLVAASLLNGIRAVAVTKPASVVFGGIGGNYPTTQSSWSYNGKPLPFANGAVPADVQAMMSSQRASKQKVSYAPSYLARLQNNTNPGAIIRVEDIKSPILLVAGGSDQLWPSAYMARQVIERRREYGTLYQDRLQIYPDAGHLIGVPYEFAAAELAHSGFAVGGTAAADEAASEQSWPGIVQFLKQAMEAS